ncbi:MAG: hypothetical protein NWF08_06145 [Candidatus Bathyarchaeota archaeon]|jgi:hypothetical protein|nr:hypothetical protein [Candidatus Bathyarchaeota archaeon]
MKSGYGAGIVAGFIAGLADFIFGGIGGLTLVGGYPLSTVLGMVQLLFTTHIGFNVIYGAIFGILFAKFYDVIPGKSGFRKGVVWGFIYMIVSNFWFSAHHFVVGAIPICLIWGVCGLTMLIFYGPSLGYLYEGTQKPVKPEDKRKHKPIASVVAGLVSGIVTVVLFFILPHAPFIWSWPAEMIPATLITNVAAGEFVVAVIYGIIFGVIFALLYARLPGKDVMKGLYYGLILFLIVDLFTLMWYLTYQLTANLQSHLNGLIMHGLPHIILGIVLGYFYKK